MTHELLALLPGHPALPRTDGITTVPAGDFTAIFLPALRARVFGKSLRRQRLAEAPRRQARLEALMPAGPVLPFAPGSALDPAEAPALVAANRDMLDGLVTRLRGQMQFQITVSWDEAGVLDRFRDAPELAPLFAAERVAGPAVAGAVARLADRLGKEIAAILAEAAEDLAELPRDQGMIANAVLLVTEDRVADLDRALETIDAIWTEGLRIRQIGPGPASSFATLRLSRFGADAVARAHGRLGLAAPVTDAAIQAARRHLLVQPGAEVETLRAAARLAEGALRIGLTPGNRDGAVHLIDLWAEGRSADPWLEDVA